MDNGTARRGRKFVLLAMLTAALFTLVIMSIVSKSLSKDAFAIALCAASSIGATSFISWFLIMPKRETKFRGAWAGVSAVLFAYPILSILMAVFDTSKIDLINYVATTTILSFSMTGLFTTSIGGYMGHKLARNIGVKFNPCFHK
ncbi:MAG: hypothetical protein V3U57_03105 [Robiginitomaculum sp.]